MIFNDSLSSGASHNSETINRSATTRKKPRYSSFSDEVARITVNPLCRPESHTNLIELNTVDEVRVWSESASALEPYEAQGLGCLHDPTFDRCIYQGLRSTYFATALRYWQSRVRIQDFQDCALIIQTLSKSLPEIILNREVIINTLLQLILKKASISTAEPAYHLISILAKDIRSEFADHLPRVLRALIGSLDPFSPKSLELTFHAVASLFRNLISLIVLDLPKYMRLYAPWLVHSSNHVRVFAAESFSFLLRHVPSDVLLKMVKLLLNFPEHSTIADTCSSSRLLIEQSNPELMELSPKVKLNSENIQVLANAVGTTLFETVKNVQKSLNSKYIMITSAVFEELLSHASQEVSQDKRCLQLTMFEFMTKVARRLIACFCGHIAGFDILKIKALSSVLFHVLKKATSQFNDCRTICNSNGFSSVLILEHLCFELQLSQEFIILTADSRRSLKEYIENVSEIVASLFAMEGLIDNSKHHPILSSCIQFLSNVFTIDASAMMKLLISDVSCAKEFSHPRMLISYLFRNTSEPLTTQAKVCLLRFIAAIVENIQDSSPVRLVETLYGFLRRIIDSSITTDRHCRVLAMSLLTELLSGEKTVSFNAFFPKIESVAIVPADYHASQILASDHKGNISEECIGINVVEAADSSELLVYLDFLNVMSQRGYADSSVKLVLSRIITCYSSQLLSFVKAFKEEVSSKVSENLSDYNTSFEQRTQSITSCIAIMGRALKAGAEIEYVSNTKSSLFIHEMFSYWMGSWGALIDCCDMSRDQMLRFDVDTVFKLISESVQWDKLFLYITNQLGCFVLRDLRDENVIQSLLKICMHCLKRPCRLIRKDALQIIMGLYENCESLSVQFFLSSHDSLSRQIASTSCNNSSIQAIQPIVKSLLRSAINLESLENSINNEKLKIQHISQISIQIQKANLLSQMTNISTLGVEILLAQLSEKFLPLWRPVVELLDEISMAISKMCSSSASYPNLCQNSMTCAIDSSQIYGRPVELEQDKCKKRKITKQSIFSSFHIWLYDRLCDSLCFVICQLTAQSELSRKAVNVKSQVNGKKRRQERMFCRIRGLPPSEGKRQDSTGVIFDSEDFWATWEEKIKSRNTFSFALSLEYTDPVTRHAYLCRVMGNLLQILKPYTCKIFQSGGQATPSTDMIEEKDRVAWAIRWFLANASVLCERYAYESFDKGSSNSILPMHANEEYQIIRCRLRRIRQARVSRTADCLRLLTTFAPVAGFVPPQGSSDNDLSHLWQEVIDVASHRILIVPDKALQSLSVQVIFSSTVFGKALVAYKDVLERIIQETDSMDTLLLPDNLSTLNNSNTNLPQNPLDHANKLIPLLIRILFAKLSKSSLVTITSFRASRAGGKANNISRRRQIFRFLNCLPSSQAPTLFAVFFLPSLQVEEKQLVDELYEDVWSEQRREYLTQSFFSQIQVGMSDSWKIARINDRSTSIELESFGVWTFRLEDRDFRVFIPTKRLSQNSKMLSAILKTVEEMILHMRQISESMILFVGQYLSSIVAQFGILGSHELPDKDEVNDTIESECEEDDGQSVNSGKAFRYPHLRRLARLALALLNKLFVRYLHLSSNWNICVFNFRDIFSSILSRSVKSGGQSNALNFVCELSRHPDLFAILATSLNQVFPLIFNTLCCTRVLDDIVSSRPPSSAIDAVLTFVLRLVRGGSLNGNSILSKMNPTNQTSVMGQRSHKAYEKCRIRDEDSESSISEEKPFVNPQSAERVHLLIEEERHCSYGKEILKPHIELLLSNLYKLFSHRKSHIAALRTRHTVFTRAESRSASRLEVKVVSNQELEVICELSQLIDSSDSIVAFQLMELLLLSLPPSKGLRAKSNGATERLQLIFSCMKFLLPHLTSSNSFIAPKADSYWLGFESLDSPQEAALLTKIAHRLTDYIQSVQELQTRQTLMNFLLCLALRRAGIKRDILQLAESLLQHLESVPAECIVVQVLPAALLTRAFSNQATDSAVLWPVSIALLLTKMASWNCSIEPDFDAQISVLTHFNALILSPLDEAPAAALDNLTLPPSCINVLLLQCIFMMTTSDTEVACREEAIKTLCNIIDRVARVSAAKMELARYNLLIDSQTIIHNPVAELFHSQTGLDIEYRNCAVLLRGILFSIVTAIRLMLKEDNFGCTRNALQVLSHIVRSFGPVRAFLPRTDYTETLCGETQEWILKNEKGASFFENRLHLDIYKILPDRRIQEMDPNHGGDVLNELLHIQRHRRAKGAALLEKNIHQLSPSTIRHICIPLALMFLTQPDASSNQAFQQALAERAAALLTQAVKFLNWTSFMSLLKRIAHYITRFPSRKSLFLQVFCNISTNYDYKAKFSAPDKKQRETLHHAINIHQEPSLSLLSQLEEPYGELHKESSPCKLLSLPVRDQDQTRLLGNPALIEIKNSESEVEKSSSHLLNDPVQSCNLLRAMQTQLLPLLRRLLKVTKKKLLHAEKTQESPALKYGKDQEVMLIRPQVVAVQLHIMKLFPPAHLEAELPRLLNTLATCLASRERESRRMARAALRIVAVSLGPQYFCRILEFLSARFTKGYQVPILTFTSVSMLTDLLFGSGHSMTLSRAELKIPVGSLDTCIPILLPMIDNELDRLCDPDRPEYGTDATGSFFKRAGIDETRHFMSGKLVLILSRVASENCLNSRILPYLNGLLSGSSCMNRARSPAVSTAFNKKYRNILQVLFEEVSLGISRNTSFSPLRKLQQSIRFLKLHATFTSSQNSPGVRNTDEDKIFLQLMTTGTIAIETTADLPTEAVEGGIKQLHMKKYILQPGAVFGKSAEQILRPGRGVDRATRASMIGVAGLRLLTAILAELKCEPAVQPILRIQKARIRQENVTSMFLAEDPEGTQNSRHSEMMASHEAKRLLECVSSYVVDCFCNKNEELFQLAAKNLLGMLIFNLSCIEKEWKRIAGVVLRILQTSSTSVSKHDSGKVRGLACTCTKVLAVLLINSPNSHEWFRQVINSTDTSTKEGLATTMKVHPQSFITALLTHIRSSLDDPHLRLASLQLFRRIINLLERGDSIVASRNIELVTYCIDEIGLLLVQRSSDEKVVGLCCSIYVDFLAIYPQTEKSMQQRVAFIVKNLDSCSKFGRQAMLAVIYEFMNRNIFHNNADRFAPKFLLFLTLRLSKESDFQTRLMTRAVISRILSHFSSEDKRLNAIKLIIKGFNSANSLLQAALADFLNLCVVHYHSTDSLKTKLGLILPVIWNCVAEQCPQKTLFTEQLPEVCTNLWKSFYLVSQCFEKIIRSLSTREIQFIISDNHPQNETFLQLWKLIVQQGMRHRNFLLKICSMKTMESVLSHADYDINFERENPTTSTPGQSIPEILFSTKVLPLLSEITNGSEIYHVTPLVRLNFDLMMCLEKASLERAPAIAVSGINFILGSCRVLLSSEKLQNECYSIPSKNGNTALADTQSQKLLHSNGFYMCFTRPTLNQARSQHLTSLSGADLPILMNYAAVSLNSNIENASRTFLENPHVNDAEQSIPHKEEASRSAHNADDTEDLLMTERTEFHRLRDSCSKNSEETYRKVVPVELHHKKLRYIDSRLQVLKQIRVPWLIRRLSNIIRLANGNPQQYKVRVVMSIKLLAQLIPLLPPLSLTAQGGSILSNIVKCLTMTCLSTSKDLRGQAHSSIGISLENALELLETAAWKYPTSQDVAYAAASLAEEALGQLRHLMKEHTLESEYDATQKRVRIVMKERRQKRRIFKKQERLLRPALATMKKIKKIQKNRILRKKKDQCLRASRGE